MLNSVNGKQESLDKILPLVKKYGATVVALTLDKSIPETTEGRIDLAKKIVREAAKHGIQKKDIIVDALTMTISTGQENAKITLDSLEYIKKELGIHTVLGVSNVSFGLPERSLINSTFFILAMNAELSAGIVNPMNAQMMNAYYSYNALNGTDANCIEYINKYSEQNKAEVKQTKETTTVTLYDSIVNGLSEQADKIAAEMVINTPPIDIINNHLIPALDKVGVDFEKNKIFLPQLLMSADSAKVAFESIKDFLAKEGKTAKKRDKIVLATVKGDIHDIGKNIVKVLLENFNFDVIDLGKNVEPSLILDTVIEQNVTLVGLSALMTTTIVYMKETIELLKEKAPNCKVMVGGAVLTQDYVDEMGADFYSKDAMGSVRYADKLLN